MAGAGYKLFNTGDVLTAAQVNTYLQEQVVMVFANAAARTTALSGVLAEGMVSYLKDTDALEIYSGAAWIGYGSGDITGVTAGTGISGGGTSGTVTITNSMATEITAAGDIIVGTGSGTFDNLPIGTTGQVLTADTTVSPYKVKWASAGSSGALTKIASGSYSAAATTNVDSVFTSTYTKYLVILQWTTSVSNANLQWQYRYSGSTENGSQYYGGAFRQDRTNTKSDYGFAGTTSATIDTNGGTASPSLAFIYVSYVGNSSQAAYGFASGYSSDNQAIFNAAHYVNVSRTYDGFALTADSGNLTGTYAVYGVTN